MKTNREQSAGASWLPVATKPWAAALALGLMSSSVLEAANKDPKVKQWLKESATAAESAMLPPFRQWIHNSSSAGNGWNSQVNNAAWGADYLNRTASAKSNMWENMPSETKYIYSFSQ